MRLRGGVFVVIAVAALASCSVDFSIGDESDNEPPEPPRITQGEVPADLEAALLEESDLADVPGLPEELEEEPLDDTALYDNPDPRAPCGAELEQPSLDDAAIRIFNAPGMGIVEYIVPVSEDGGARFVEDIEADIDPGCPAWASETPNGDHQTGELEAAIDLPPLGDARVAATVRVAYRDLVSYGAESIVVDGERLLLITVIGEDPPDPETVVAVTQRAFDRMQSAPT